MKEMAKVLPIKTSTKRCTSVPEDSFILANSADPGEMLLFYRGLHCLPKYHRSFDKHYCFYFLTKTVVGTHEKYKI